MKFKEAPRMCCVSGEVKLSEHEQPKGPLKNLLNGINDDSNSIKKYNSCFQMTSFGANVIAKHFMRTFKIQAQIYNKAGFFCFLFPAMIINFSKFISREIKMTN